MANISIVTAADRVRAAASLPTTERGSILPARQQSPLVPGWSVWEAQARTIKVDALKWPRSRETYEDMSRDPQIQGLLMSVFLPIRHMNWYVDPAGTTGTVAEEIAEDFGLPLQGDEQADEDGPGVDYDEHLRLALLMLQNGHQYFEETGVIEGTGMAAKYRLRRLHERPKETIERIDVTPGGDLVSVRVTAAQPAIDGPFVDVPADHLLAYCWDRRGADWAGRALAPETEIPTPDGWRTMDDLQPGDRIFDEAGMIRHVVDRKDWKDRPCYEVEFSSGDVIVADANHQWVSHTYRTRNLRLHGPETVTTEEMAGTVMKYGLSNHAVPIARSLEYVRQHQLIDPYVFGYWLGDGDSNGAIITTADPEVLSLCNARGYPSTHIRRSPSTKPSAADKYRLPGTMQTCLRVLGVYKNKHVPESYLRGDHQQRLDLLRGLMDSDGNVGGKKGGRAEFTNTNRLLSEGVLELALSLGGRGRITKKVRGIEKVMGKMTQLKDTWHVNFATPDNPFGMTRKADRYSSQRKRPRRYHYITDVRPVANRDTVCIETDAPSHLFLAGRTLIQTHNSLLYGLYRAWLLKDELVREDATMVRRFGGIPVVETTDPNVSAAATQEAATMAQAVQSGDGAGAATPFGTRLRILGVEGTLPKPLESIKYHDQQMARAFMQMVMELGNTSHGSRALGSTLMDHYALGVLSIAKAVQKTQMQLVRRIVVRNYGANAPLPHIRFRQDDHEDITPTDLVGLIEAGAITVDDDLEAQIRKQSNLVPRNPALTGRLLPTAKPAAVPVPVAATATSREHIHRHDHSASAAATVPTDLIAPAQVDFEALRESHATAVLLLTATWNGVQAALIADLTAQIAAATGVEDVAGVTPMVLGGAALAALLVDVVEHGAQSALGEFEAQGVTIPAPDLTATHAMIAASAAATAIMLSNALGQSASSAAVASWGPDANPSFIADVVQQHLEGLAGATPNYEMTALASRAQNAGRGTVFEHSPTGTHYIASAVLDDHACTACLQDNGRTFATLDEARVIFPGSGQNSDCSGRGRCRCVLVAVVEDSITVA